ncbi:MAG TPA: family 20 glycosylhydrolase, partial [Cytophagaceae bacterium]
AWRKETLIGHSYESPKKYDGKRYGGYYTQDEVKEVVQYAAERYITVVPEIELPGHASAAIAAYPTLGVTGKPIDVVTSWGIFPNIFNIEDSTFLFLEDVLTEVMDLFPSEYIHVGGDEAIKEQWEASPRIQQQIRQLGLKNEHELQSYFIKRIEKFINSKGRKLIGWDEILEGGLAPNAAVMSWRGTAGGEAAAKAGHYVVMSPTSHLYFDYYQGNPGNEPLAIGGYTPLQKVYSYEPTPESLTEEEAKYILGAQANVWTEYIKTPEHVEYMVFPRISALAEVVWSPREKRNWDWFKSKLPELLERYKLRGINYSNSVYKIAFKSVLDSVNGTLKVVMGNELGTGEIRYTLDGSNPTKNSSLYKDGIHLRETSTIKTQVFEGDMPLGNIEEQRFIVHKAYGKEPQFTHPYTIHHFPTHGLTLTDGMLGSKLTLFSDLWQRFNKVDLEATIDLGKTDTIEMVKARFVSIPHYSIVPPKSLSVQLSLDGKEYTKAGAVTRGVAVEGNSVWEYEVNVKTLPARYVMIKAENVGSVKSEKTGKFKDAVLMTDEIIIE